MYNYEELKTAMGDLEEEIVLDMLREVMEDGGSKAGEAMTACQDVAAAIMGGGLLTIMCGIVCTIVPLLLIPVISKLGAPSEPLPPLNKE